MQQRLSDMSRLPTQGDFEKPVNSMVGPSPPDHTMRPPPKLDIIPPSSGSPVNVLILLHGLGDTKAPFAQFAQNMNLKETVCISLQGPTPLPDIFNPLDRPAFHWSDDITFEDDRLNIDNGFKATSKLISEHVIPVLHHKCNFPLRNIFFFGFGQGGMAALHAVTQYSGNEEFGGVISIGGRFPESTRVTSVGKYRTPVLVCAGSRSQEVNQTSLHTLREKFQDVEYVKWMKHDDSMPKNAEEMRPVFAFLARRMRSRAGVPEGAVEI